MIEALGAVVRFAAALLLLYAAAQKFAAPRLFRQTLDALRVPVAGRVTFVVPLVEVVAAVGLIAAPHSVVTVTLVAGLGLSFAGAALVALSRGEEIRCACYGQAGDAKLGFRQVAALPAWLGVAAVSLLVPDGGTSGLPYVAAVGLVLAVFITARLLLPVGLRSWRYLKVLESQWDSSGPPSAS